MTSNQFNSIMEEQINYCKDLLIKKTTEYKSDVNRFHTFEVAAALQGIDKKQALAGMMAKHTASIYDMCKNGEYPTEKWTEKITDHINYLLLLKAMIMEEKNNEKN